MGSLQLEERKNEEFLAMSFRTSREAARSGIHAMTVQKNCRSWSGPAGEAAVPGCGSVMAWIAGSSPAMTERASSEGRKSWMAGTGPAMTMVG
jgi:hypothetical protein